MTDPFANMQDIGINSLALAGPLTDKLRAFQSAGFQQILLAASDLMTHPEGLDVALTLVRSSGLRVMGLQALNDFEGLSGAAHSYKVDVAKSMLGLCQRLDCHLLLVNASTLEQATSDTDALCVNLRQLAMLAIPMDIRIAYKASPNGRAISNYGQAWDLLCQADMPNLGLCLDAMDALTWHGPHDDLEMLDCEKVFLTQLTDVMGGTEPGQCVFPGEGDNSPALAQCVTTLHNIGYRGNYCLGAFNHDNTQLPPVDVAQRARRSALWLGQDVLQRSVPLPNQIRLKRRQIA
jgi:sugar phosphate isomerase/epimerase